MSIPAVAASGTELMFIPPDTVPTLSVGSPSSACPTRGSSNASSAEMARAIA